MPAPTHSSLRILFLSTPTTEKAGGIAKVLAENLKFNFQVG